jgi:hypothetical protein
MPMRRRVMLAGLASRAFPAWGQPQRAQPQPAAPALADYVGNVLTRLIEAARQQAIADGVRPLPAAVVRSLLGYFPATLLQKTRFASGNAEPLSLPGLAFSYGDAIAVTLGDVVLFRAERRAQTDLKVWAHELTHVMQYQRWGIDGFAERYARDSAAVEQEAIDNANRFMAWHSRQGRA